MKSQLEYPTTWPRSLVITSLAVVREGGSREHGSPKPAKLLNGRSGLRVWHQDGVRESSSSWMRWAESMEAGHNDERSDGCYGETEPQPPVGDAEVSLKRDRLREQSFEVEERHVDLHATASGRGTLSEARGPVVLLPGRSSSFQGTLRRERVVVFCWVCRHLACGVLGVWRPCRPSVHSPA